MSDRCTPSASRRMADATACARGSTFARPPAVYGAQEVQWLAPLATRCCRSAAGKPRSCQTDGRINTLTQSSPKGRGEECATALGLFSSPQRRGLSCSLTLPTPMGRGRRTYRHRLSVAVREPALINRFAGRTIGGLFPVSTLFARGDTPCLPLVLLIFRGL